MARLKYYNTTTESWESISVNGKDGYTPIKGVDYFDGEPGANGKSAYAYAQEAGYTGTEEEFGEKLAMEPLSGTSSEIKPSQAYEAITAGRDVNIIYIDKTFGLFCFTSFDVNVSLNVIFSSSILQYNGMYAVVELIGYTNTDQWEFIVQQIPVMSDVPVPVVGTTAEITPSQVKALMDAGKPFAITHTDSTYGSMLFNSFVYSQAVGSAILSTTVFKVGGVTFCAQLTGDFSNDTWAFEAFQLATTEDIPTVPSALKNPYALTINGTSYDGSEEISVEIDEMKSVASLVFQNGNLLEGSVESNIDSIYASNKQLCIEYESDKNNHQIISLNLLQRTSSNKWVFGGLLANGVLVVVTVNSSDISSSTETIYSFATDADIQEIQNKIPVVPTTLPNPNALIINGITYDGSEQKTIETEIFYINYNKTDNSFDKTLEQIEAAYQAKRQIVCIYPRFEPYVSFISLSLRGSAYEWEFSDWIDNENYITIQNKDGKITIFESNLPSKIEQIVDQKIASMPNAEEVAF